MAEGPRISVVVAVKEAGETLEECIKALRKQRGEETEIILVNGTGEALESREERTVEARAAELVPILWKKGYEAARGEIVAFTTGECIPGGDWLEQMQKGLAGSVAAVGGPIEGPEGSRGLDWVVYFARFSGFMPPGKAGPVNDLPGDNAAYRRSALAECKDEMAAGFWETKVNAKLRATGEILLWMPEMTVRQGQVNGIGRMAATRLRHGRQYGATRAGNNTLTRLIRTVTSPLIAPVLLSRISRRIRQQKPEWKKHLWRALPVLFVLLCAWALGEASGYIIPIKEQDERANP